MLLVIVAFGFLLLILHVEFYTQDEMNDEFDIREEQSSTDRDFEKALRPARFTDFAGQEPIINNLKVFVAAARKRGEALDHTLFYGPPGLGKTTLSSIIANEMGVGFKVTSGPVLDKPGDLAGLLTSLEENDVLFIDEIHRLSPIVEEYLYSAMEDYRIDIMIDKGPGARSVQLTLAPFTLIGATTRSGLLTAPLRARFGINCHLEYYNHDVLQGIVKRSARLLKVPIDDDAAREIALRSLGGGPVGLTTLAAALNEDAGTIEEVYEPFLIKEGFIKRTPRGRVATDHAFTHLKIDRPQRPGEQGSLF